MQFYLNKDISNIKSTSRPQTSSHKSGEKRETLEPTCPYHFRSNRHSDSISAGEPPPIAKRRGPAPPPSSGYAPRSQHHAQHAVLPPGARRPRRTAGFDSATVALPSGVGGGAEVEGRGGVGVGEPGGEAASGGGVEVSGMANREDEGRARCAFVEGREESTFGEIAAAGGGSRRGRRGSGA